MVRAICKGEENETHVCFKVREDGVIKFYNIPFNNYFFIYESDLEMAEYWLKNYILETEIINSNNTLFAKITINDNTKRYYIQSILNDKEIQHFELDVPADKRLILDSFNDLHQDKMEFIFIDIETYDMKPLVKNMMGKVEGTQPVLSFATKDMKGNTTFHRNEGLDTPMFQEYKDRYFEYMEIRRKIDTLNDEILEIRKKDILEEQEENKIKNLELKKQELINKDNEHGATEESFKEIDALNDEILEIRKKDILEERDNAIIEQKKEIRNELMVDFKGLKNFLDSHELLVLQHLEIGEKPLLEKYKEEVSKYDVALAYNGWGFDFPFLKDRFTHHGIDYTEMYIVDSDYMQIVMANTYGERKNNSLQAVAEDELSDELETYQNTDELDENELSPELDCLEDVGKIDWKKITNAKKYFELFLCYPEILKDYNIQDVNLLYMIENKLKLLLILIAACKECNCLLNDSIFNSKSLDNMFLQKYRERGLVSPSKPDRATIEQRKDKFNGIFPGGGYTYVFEPGLHKELHCNDFKSFYPTTVITYEISPEAYVKKVYPNLKLIFTEKEIEYIMTAQSCAKEHLGSDGKIKNKPYEKFLEQKAKDLGVDDMNTLMYKFVREYYNKDLLEECKQNNWTMTPGDINYDTRGWKVYPHYIFKKAKEGERNIFPEFSVHAINTRDEKKYQKKKFVEGSSEYESMDKFEKGIKRLGNCFSLDTEIMTVGGVKKVEDVKLGDKVYSMNKETREIEIATVIKEIRDEHNGEMIHFKNRNIDLLVTPDHNMLKITQRGNIKFEKAKNLTNNFIIPQHKGVSKKNIPDYIYLFDLVDYKDYNYTLFTKEIITKDVIKKMNNFNVEVKINKNNRKHNYLIGEKEDIRRLLDEGHDIRMRNNRAYDCSYSGIKIKIEDFSELLGYYIADGSLSKSKRKNYGLKFREDRGVYRENIRGVYKRINITKYYYSIGYDKIEELIKRLKMNVQFYRRSLSFCNDAWYDVLKKCGTNAQEKNIPKEFKSFLNYEILFESMYLCDGTKGKDLYSTTSDTLKNDLKEVCFLIGRNFNARLEETEKYRVWRINCSKINNTKFIRKQYIKKIKDPEKYKTVVCITLDKNNTVYVGRNDTFTWCGQSAYGFFAFKGSRYFMEEVPNAITSSCRATIKKSILLIEDQGFKISHGDTDSTYYKVITKDKTVEELNEIIFDYYNEMVKEFNCDAKIEMKNPRVVNEINRMKNKLVSGFELGEFPETEEDFYVSLEYFEDFVNEIEGLIKLKETKIKTMSKHFIIFEYEKTFETCIVVAKKRYYFKLKKPDGTYKYGTKGGAFKKTDVLPIAGKMQKELCKDILDLNFDANIWYEKIKNMRELVFSKKIPAEDLVKIKGLKRAIYEYGKPMIDKKTGEQKKTKDGKLRFAPIPAHVQVAKKMEEDGEIVDLNDKIKYIVKERIGASKKIVPISPMEFYQIREYDTEYYWENFESVLKEILNVTRPELVETKFEDCWNAHHKKKAKELAKKKKVKKNEE